MLFGVRKIRRLVGPRFALSPGIAPESTRFIPRIGLSTRLPHRRSLSLFLMAALVLGSAGAALPLRADTPKLNIKQLSLEELMDIDVYSASRRLEPVQGIPSAIYVLTAEDIRRARVTSVPEALRLVPGVQVARIDANKWAVGIRGFNSRTSNKLLVLVDGRSIYDPLFSGVLWESRDIMPESIERIEVIRGPGGTLWGANAVNGVINIITKHARDTQGGLVTTGVGTEERAFGAARYGWKTGDQQYARLYAKSFTRDTGFSPTGNAHDETQMNRGGFRWDWDASARDVVQISGDVYQGEAGERNSATATQDVDHRGRNLLAHWTRRVSDTESWRVQLYYDHLELDNVQLGEKRDTYDLELQHGSAPAAGHRIVWGLKFRSTRDNIRNGPLLALDPTQRQDSTQSAFLQDTIALTPQTLQLTLGTKLERNDYSGTEWQPNARLAWTPDTQRMYWAAVSRAVRVPSRLEADLVFLGNRLGDDVQAERVYAYELGHRRLLTPTFWYDIAAFHNAYRNLLTVEQNFQFHNRMRAKTYGLELAGRWQAEPHWRLDAAYTYLQMVLDLDPTSIATTQPGTTEGSNPHHQLTLRSAYDIRSDWQFDATLRFVDDLPAINVPSYVTLDLALSWLPRPDIELSLVGQNLLDSHHPEHAIVANGSGTEVQRGVYAKLTWRF